MTVARVWLYAWLLPSLSLAFMRATLTADSVPRSPTRTAMVMQSTKTSAPKRIGLLVEPTPFTHVSGYANRFNEMLKYMAKAGENVEIITVDDTPEAPASKFGYPINTIKGFRFVLYNEIALTFDLKQRTLAVMRRFKPDILHVTSPGFLVFVGVLTARILKVPLVFSYHTHLPVYAKQYFPVPGIDNAAWKILKFVHNRADLNLVTSPQMKEELEANGIERVEVWRKGIDVDVFQPKYKDAEMRNMLTDGHPDSPLLLYVGRLGQEKRLKDLREVLRANPTYRLAFVGKGPEREELESYFKGTNTVFTGLLRGEDLSKAFASADVFCMPSDSETLGFVVLESMASGVPVVGAKAGGIPSLIRDGETGYLVEPGNMEVFTDRVRKLIEDKEWRETMGAAVRAEAELWGWEASTSHLRNVQYALALENYKRRPLDVMPTNFDVEGLSDPDDDDDLNYIADMMDDQQTKSFMDDK